MNNTIILVAARLKSTRLKRKIVKIIAGKMVIHHLIDRLSLVKNASDVVVCTSTNSQDKPIYDFCQNINVKCYRGSEDDVMGRFIGSIEHYNLATKNIVRVTADSPLISFEMMDKAIKEHNSLKADVTIMKDLPIGMDSEVINYNYFKYLYKKVEDPNSSEYMTWMLDRPDICNVHATKTAKYNRPNYRLTFDTTEDLKLIKLIYNNLYKGNPIPSKEIIEYLDSNSDLTKINSNVQQINYDDVKDHININIKKH